MSTMGRECQSSLAIGGLNRTQSRHQVGFPDVRPVAHNPSAKAAVMKSAIALRPDPLGIGIAVSMRPADGQDSIDPFQIRLRKRQPGARNTFPQMFDRACPRYRDNMVPPGQKPGDREARGRNSHLRGETPETLGDPQILRQVRLHETRVLPKERHIRDPLRRDRIVRQQRTPDGREGYERDAELGAGLHQPEIGKAGRKRIFGLNGGDRVDHHRAPQGRGGDLRKPDRPGLALLHKPDEIGRSFLRCEARVATMGIEEIDAINAQPQQRRIQLRFEMFGGIVEGAIAVGIAGNRCLGGDHEFVPRAGMGFQIGADRLFRLAHAIDIRRVQVGDAQV
ncbi:MAG: hypothetical protein MI923_06430, partial [Phycisphaerales bacterium]|nr:hypothetical protein [Phycisphaerales bacterium]